MKKKFKKVIEWKERPKCLEFSLSIASFLIPIIIFVNMCHTPPFGKLMGVIFIYLLIIFGVLEFEDSLGKGRKVTWEEIK